MKYSEFKSLIEKTYAGKFPESFCNVRICKFSGWANIGIDCYLAKSDKECAYGYYDNDPIHVKFTVELPRGFDENADELPENLTLESRVHYYHIKPVKDKWLAYESRDIPFRKSSGTPEKLAQSFGKFIAKLHESVKTDAENHAFTDEHNALALKKISR